MLVTFQNDVILCKNRREGTCKDLCELDLVFSFLVSWMVCKHPQKESFISGLHMENMIMPGPFQCRHKHNVTLTCRVLLAPKLVKPLARNQKNLMELVSKKCLLFDLKVRNRFVDFFLITSGFSVYARCFFLTRELTATAAKIESYNNPDGSRTF